MEYHQYLMRIMSIAKIGQKYSKDPYALENYRELEKLSLEMLNDFVEPKYTENLYIRNIYPTPNVSVRGLVIKDGKILMVKERDDNGWAIPGGWCEVFLSPSQNIVKEIKEETGYRVTVNKLLAIFQREKYKNYPSLVSEYSLYFGASIIDGVIKNNHEVSDVAFFDYNELPFLSKKTTLQEIAIAYDVLINEKEIHFE